VIIIIFIIIRSVNEEEREREGSFLFFSKSFKSHHGLMLHHQNYHLLVFSNPIIVWYTRRGRRTGSHGRSQS
jgi:hypothetical protein